MVELGDDDRIAGAEPTPQGPRQMERQRGHVGAKGDLVGRGIEKVGQGLPRRQNRRVRLLAGRESPVSVGIVVNEVIGHRLDHDPRNLGPARPVEVGDTMAMMHALESGESRPDLGGRRDGEPERSGRWTAVMLSLSASRRVVGFQPQVPTPGAGIVASCRRGWLSWSKCSQIES